MSSQTSVSSQSSGVSSRDSLDLSRLDQLFHGLAARDRETGTVEVHDNDITYTVWITYAEIYNENIYDLLQKVTSTTSLVLSSELSVNLLDEIIY